MLPLALVLSVALPGAAFVAGATGAVVHPGAATASIAGLTGAGLSVAPAAAPAPAVPVGGQEGGLFASPPNKGIINDYEFAPGGATTADPATAYDTVSFEPIANVHEPLIAWNGTTTVLDPSQFVPVLATCVPGTAQCATDYPGAPATDGSGHPNTDLITYVGGQATAYTFVIDPAAKFFNPLHPGDGGWPVYPTDVMFSVARTAGFATQPFEQRYNGWILAQALLPAAPIGSETGTWNNGNNTPLNNTPGWVLGSMLINDSNYCLATAMFPIASNGHGCVTFLTNNSGANWPFFEELLADQLGGSIVSCGAFSDPAGINSGVPGFGPSSAPHSDGPCKLPGDASANPSTSDASYKAYLGTPPTTPTAGDGTGLFSNVAGPNNMTSWNPFEGLAQNYPTVQAGAQWNVTGSGPYYANLYATVGLSYTLQANPYYAQPSACGGNPGGYAQYLKGYCDPPADGLACVPLTAAYPCQVNVVWQQSDTTTGFNKYVAGQTDFATLLPTDTAELVALAHSSALACTSPGNSCGAPWNHQNKLNVFYASSFSNFAFMINFNFNESRYASRFPTFPSPVLPTYTKNGYTYSHFFSGMAIRGILAAAYPYTQIQNNVWTQSGIVYQNNFVGGPIPKGMGNYYPSSFPWPYQVNGGNPDVGVGSASHPGSPTWWWAQANNPLSPYYDPSLSICTHATPCKFPIESQLGFVSEDNVVDDFIAPIITATNGALAPFRVDVNFQTGLGQIAAPNRAGTVYFLGWAPDYPDPTDYVPTYAGPNGAFGAADSYAPVLNLPQFNQTGQNCTHDNLTWSDLSYWANQTFIPQHCQSVPYNATVQWTAVAGTLSPGFQRTLEYAVIEKVLNASSLEVWQGQSNIVGSAAPWIAADSINTNPTIGGGGDQLFFEVKYAAPLTVHEVGLLPLTPWGINVGGQNYNTTATSEVIGAATGINSWSPIAPAGYGLAHTAPLVLANPLTVAFPLGTSITLFFAKTNTVTIVDPGLPAGTHVSLTLIPPLHWFPTIQVQTGIEPVTFTFLGVVAGVWHYKVAAIAPTPNGLFSWKLLGAQLASLSSPVGAAAVVPASGLGLTVTLNFLRVANATLVFVETGLPLGHPTFSVTVTGTMSDGELYGPTTIFSVGASPVIIFHLADGVYTYVLSHTSGKTAPGGSITLGSAHAWTPPSPVGTLPAHTSGWPIVAATMHYT